MPDARKYMFMPVKRRFLRPNALLKPIFFKNIKPTWLEGWCQNRIWLSFTIIGGSATKHLFETSGKVTRRSKTY